MAEAWDFARFCTPPGSFDAAPDLAPGLIQAVAQLYNSINLLLSGAYFLKCRMNYSSTFFVPQRFFYDDVFKNAAYAAFDIDPVKPIKNSSRVNVHRVDSLAISTGHGPVFLRRIKCMALPYFYGSEWI